MLVDRFFTVATWMLPIYGALHFLPSMLFRPRAWAKEWRKMLPRAAVGTLRSSGFLGMFVVIYQAMNCGMHIWFEHLLSILLSPEPSIAKWVLGSVLGVTEERLRTLLVSPVSFCVPGLATGLALFIEEKRRRAELAMYVLPKALESFWLVATVEAARMLGGTKVGRGQRQRRVVPPMEDRTRKMLLDGLFGGVAMGLVMVCCFLLKFFFFLNFLFLFLWQSTYQNNPHHLSGLVRRVLYQFIGPN
jgi:hypothetical protein